MGEVMAFLSGSGGLGKTALTAGLAAVACYTFAGIPGESGYVAVGDFVGALATTIVALACMYIMGGRKRIR